MVTLRRTIRVEGGGRGGGDEVGKRADDLTGRRASETELLGAAAKPGVGTWEERNPAPGESQDALLVTISQPHRK